MSRYQKGKTNLDFTGARGSEWQWYQLGHMQVCISLQTDNHASTPPLSFLQAGCPSCHPTNSVKALKATSLSTENKQNGTKHNTQPGLTMKQCNRINQRVCFIILGLSHQNVKSFQRTWPDRVEMLLKVSVIHQLMLRDHRSHGVAVYIPAFAGTNPHCSITGKCVQTIYTDRYADMPNRTWTL